MHSTDGAARRAAPVGDQLSTDTLYTIYEFWGTPGAPTKASRPKAQRQRYALVCRYASKSRGAALSFEGLPKALNAEDAFVGLRGTPFLGRLGRRELSAQDQAPGSRAGSQA